MLSNIVLLIREEIFQQDSTQKLLPSKRLTNLKIIIRLQLDLFIYQLRISFHSKNAIEMKLFITLTGNQCSKLPIRSNHQLSIGRHLKAASFKSSKKLNYYPIGVEPFYIESTNISLEPECNLKKMKYFTANE